jgi:hypothetical protein
LATLAGIDVSATLTYDTVMVAIKDGIKTLDDAEVNAENRILFVSPDVHQLMSESGEFMNVRTVDSVTGVINTQILNFEGMPIIKVPQNRFYTKFLFNDGTTGGQEAGGFVPAIDGKVINFIICDKNAPIDVIRYFNPKLIDPKFNATADSWKFGYRIQKELFLPTNKIPAVYVHAKA